MAEVHSGSFLVRGDNTTNISEILLTDVPLSFWGGIEPETGRIVDVTHPLFGENVTDKILCLPSGRGSCTASQVLLELILNKKAPRAIVLRDVDGLVCVGALVAQEVFEDTTVPDILCLGTDSFNKLLQQKPLYGVVSEIGDLIVSQEYDAVEAAVIRCSEVPSASSSLGLVLTDEEQNMWDAATSDAERMALRVLIRYARLTASSPNEVHYIDVVKAHIDGCTYIGPGGLDFVQKLQQAGGKVKIPTTLNSVSADRCRWQALGVPKDRALASIAVGDSYLALGCEHSFTCAPYLLPDPPRLGQDIVWGESNAVVYANTVLGARTEKYADYLDICCALVGKVPAAGVHLEENRQPRIVLDATDLLHTLRSDCSGSLKDLELLFPVLGYLSGSLSDGYVPILLGFDGDWSECITPDNLKSFCAAYGTTGTSPLIHIAGVTPEAKTPSLIDALIDNCDQPAQTITMLDLQKTFDALDSSSQADETEKVDLVALGNPHLSLTECQNLDRLVGKSKKEATTRIMACMSRALYSKAKTLGYVSRLERFGVEFVNDTCWCMLLDGPVIPSNQDAVILTNSGKYAHYGPGLTDRQFRFGSMEDCVEAAVTGQYPLQQQTLNSAYPTWLSRNRVYGGQRRSFSNCSSRGSLCSTVLPLLRKKRQQSPRESRIRTNAQSVFRLTSRVIH